MIVPHLDRGVPEDSGTRAQMHIDLHSISFILSQVKSGPTNLLLVL